VIDRRRSLAAIALLIVAGVVVLMAAASGSQSAAPRRSPRAAARAEAAGRSIDSPRCTPSSLNRSAVLPGTPLSVSPLPGTMVAEPSAQISMLGVPADEISAVSVTGSRTGVHQGRLIAYAQGDGASFVSQRPFAAGERVTVRGTLLLAGGRRPFAYAFTVADEDPLPDRTAQYTATTSPVGIQRFHSQPQLPAPTVHVTTAATSGAVPADIFVAAYATANGPGGPMIFGNDGQLVWFKALPSKISAANLQVQEYQGHPVLTWWQGRVLPQGFGEGEGIIDNTDYQQIAVVHAGNGLHEDLHELQLTPDGTALITAYDPIHCNLLAVGGPANGAITDGVFQEIDLKTGLVRREWHALDHVPIADAYPKINAGEARTAFPFDFFHINSLDPLPNGTVMVSSRNTWTIYTLDERTGEVLARFGGKHSTVTMGPGTATAWQHDARTLSNGDVTVFDNGAEPKIHPYSRGLVERLDPSTNTMTRLAQYSHSPPLSAGTQGNVQTLSNGDTLIGWGAEPYVSEYSATGQLLFEARLAAGGQSYRAFGFPWTAQPLSSPRITLAPAKAPSAGVAYVSWNGATRVASWRVLAGRDGEQLTPLTTVARTGFETTIPLASRGPWFQVQALDSSGRVLGSSAVTRTP
jgi:Arylsulfotransferase (ASST)